MIHYFTGCISSGKIVNVITTNGFQIHCKIIGFHKDPGENGPIVMIDVITEKQQINHIMLHAISTIAELE